MQSNDNWFNSIDRKPTPTPPSIDNSLFVEKIAPSSPADLLGIKPGDVLLRINNIPALDVDLEHVLSTHKKVDYCFYLNCSNELLKISTNALPLGAIFNPSLAGIVDQYKWSSFQDFDGLIKLWDLNEYDLLREAVENAMHIPLWLKFIIKLLGKSTAVPQGDLFLGICEIEKGNRQKGYALIDQFNDSRYDYTSDLHCLYYTYMAFRERDRNEPDRYNEFIKNAHDAHQKSTKVNALAKEIGLETFEHGPWMSRAISVPYKLEYLEGGSGETSLAALIEDMPPTQVMPLCLMPGYRGNGPYNEYIQIYRSIYAHMSDKIHPMVVIVGEKTKRSDRSYWYEEEEKVIKSGLPIKVLLEETEKFAEDLRITGSPSFLTIDKNSQVVWDKAFDTGYNYWEMLGDLNDR